MRSVMICMLVGVAALAACGRGPAATPGATKADETETAKLESADASDGTEDHIVVKCAVCGLGMDGTPEHVSRYAGYELRFCSRECKETFDHDPHAVLRRLPTPVA